jgi:hypothetical protein
MDSAYAHSATEVLQHFSVFETKGLSDAQVQESRDKHGRNGKQTRFPQHNFAPRFADR